MALPAPVDCVPTNHMWATTERLLCTDHGPPVNAHLLWEGLSGLPVTCHLCTALRGTLLSVKARAA
jgi:hypothetical protein